MATWPCIFGSLENDIFATIGLIMLIGLSAKNAILIVEFAKTNYEAGQSIAEAALGAARLRFRPIVMTALAFVFGCLPLWVASGAGGASRRILGTVVVGGMFLSTAIGLIFIPVTFSVVEYLSHRFARGGKGKTMDSKGDLDPVRAWARLPGRRPRPFDPGGGQRDEHTLRYWWKRAYAIRSTAVPWPRGGMHGGAEVHSDPPTPHRPRSVARTMPRSSTMPRARWRRAMGPGIPRARAAGFDSQGAHQQLRSPHRGAAYS